MKGKLFFLSIVAVAFVVVLGFSAVDTARAVPGIGDEGYNWFPSGQGTLFGYDAARNFIPFAAERDRDAGNLSEGYDGFPNSYHP